MFDGFWEGIIGGLFGPLAVRYLGRFRLVMIFVCCVLLTPIVFFLLDTYESGWVIAIYRILSKKLFGVLLLGAVLGALAVLGVWVCMKLAPHDSAKARSNLR